MKSKVKPIKTNMLTMTEEKEAKSKYQIGNREIDDQAERMTEYGGRFVTKIEEAVSSAANLSATFRKAIESGDWRYTLTDILGNIVNSLADSFGKDAQNNLAGMAKGLFSGLLGLTPSMSQGSLPSYSMGTASLPSYSNGLGTMGSEYPRTAVQDGREPRQSHLAVLNKDEIVLNHEQTNKYLNHQTANQAIANVRPSYISNTRTSQDTNISNNYSNYVVQQDTFGRNSGITAGERSREERRLGG
jgi:hypothetical protein